MYLYFSGFHIIKGKQEENSLLGASDTGESLILGDILVWTIDTKKPARCQWIVIGAISLVYRNKKKKKKKKKNSINIHDELTSNKAVYLIN